MNLIHVPTTLLLIYAPLTLASLGDIQRPYRQCVEVCQHNLGCPQDMESAYWIYHKCFICRHDCMQETVQLFVEAGHPIPQFHGKWPITLFQFYGYYVQEPISTLGSLLNLLTTSIMYKTIKSDINKFGKERQFDNHNVWIEYSRIGIVTWICSSAFHTFDCYITERLDYFAAFALVLGGFYVSIHVTLLTPSHSWRNSITPFFLRIAFFLFYTLHVVKLTRDFDYGYNMKVCVMISLLTTALYITFVIRNRLRNGFFSRSDLIAVGMIIWANMAVMFELLDFVPIWGVMDAHSLFHLATIPLPLCMLSYLFNRTKEVNYHRLV